MGGILYPYLNKKELYCPNVYTCTKGIKVKNFKITNNLFYRFFYILAVKTDSAFISRSQIQSTFKTCIIRARIHKIMGLPE